MTVPFQIKNVACIGSGVIGAGWIARFIENGINVKIFDPDPNVKKKCRPNIEECRYRFFKFNFNPTNSER